MSRNLEIEHEQFLEDIEQLLLSSGFKELESRLESKEPNIWQILNISRKEVLATKFLAWLLNPQRQHGFDSQFLKELVVEAMRNDKDRQITLPLVKLLLMDFSEAEVIVEGQLGRNGRPDIIIFDNKAEFLCIIENKIGSKERNRQTNKYYEHSFEQFSKEKYPHRIYIYLSPNGDHPTNEHFIALSYQSVLRVIASLKEKKLLSETEKFLLSQFYENVRRSIIVDDETRELIREIYDVYGPVIDFIYENAQKSETSTSNADWDGKTWFFNIGEVGQTPYSWEDSRNYRFICAGGGKRFRKIMRGLKVGDIIYAYVSQRGYVGVGKITNSAMPFRDAVLDDGQTELIDLYQKGKLSGTYNSSPDNDNCDWVAPIRWIKTVNKNDAIHLTPIVPSVAARIYAHRKELIEKINQGLGIKSVD